jgi:hypothetical protein
MRNLTIGVVLSLAACSGRSTGAEQACERADHLGDFAVHFEQVSGDCGTPLDELASYETLEQTGPCERLESDTWSDGDCTRLQRFRCGEVEFVTELTLLDDGSLVGRETRIISGGCTGTYDVTLTRR